MAKKEYKSSTEKNREAFNALTEIGGTVPPQAVELEEAVLGALMLDKDSVIAVQEYISPDSFYEPVHRTIYKAIEELATELKPIDLLTVTEKLKQQRKLKEIGKMIGVQLPLTMYVARHSWASVAKNKNVPISVISEGMGHDSEMTTQIYLASLDTSVVDKANSMILNSL